MKKKIKMIIIVIVFFVILCAIFTKIIDMYSKKVNEKVLYGTIGNDKEFYYTIVNDDGDYTFKNEAGHLISEDKCKVYVHIDGEEMLLREALKTGIIDEGDILNKMSRDIVSSRMHHNGAAIDSGPYSCDTYIFVDMNYSLKKEVEGRLFIFKYPELPTRYELTFIRGSHSYIDN